MPSRLRRRILIAALACLCVGGTVVANVALLGLADRPRDKIGRLTLRLDQLPATTPGTSPPPPVVTPAPPRDDERGPDD